MTEAVAVKPGRLGWIQLYTGILLIVMSIVLNGSLVSKITSMNDRYGFTKVTASLKNQLDRSGQKGLILNEALWLEQFLNNGVITYRANPVTNLNVTFENQTCQAQILGVNFRYPEFYQLKLLQGAFWNRSGDAGAQMVAVIDQELAWNLFKATRVVGRVLHLGNWPVRIIGVIEQENSVFDWLTDSGVPKLYIPAATLLSIDNQARITNLEWLTADTGTLDLNKTILSGALQQIGKNPDDFTLIDWNIKRVLLEQKPRLLTLVIGILIVFTLLRYLVQEFQTVYFIVKVGCRSEYLRTVLKMKVQVIRGSAFKIILCLGAILLLWLGCAFKPYIPPRYIPDELIDITYYVDLFQSGIQTGIAAMGDIPSHTEQLLHQAEMSTSWLLILGLAGGLPLLHIGLSGVKRTGTGPYQIMLRCGLGVLGATLITAICAWLLGVPPVMDLRNIWIVWAFVFGKALTS